MRILLTNDDGIHAPGLKVLEEIAAQFSDDVWVVAPDDEQSGASHSLTLSSPLRVRKLSERRFAVRGTPTDCVLMATRHLVEGKRPQLLLSGVNRGSNIADDVTYSGTVAGAMEGTILAIPSIALSQSRDNRDGAASVTRWETARRHAPDVIAFLLKYDQWPQDVLFNVNFPDVPSAEVVGMKLARQGKRDQSLARIERREDPHGVPYYWVGFADSEPEPVAESDLSALAGGWVSITPLHLNLTHEPTFGRMLKLSK